MENLKTFIQEKRSKIQNEIDKLSLTKSKDFDKLEDLQGQINTIESMEKQFNL